MEAVVLISDPWEFGTECGVGPFRGRVVERTESAILIALDSPLLYQSKTLRGMIAMPRHTRQFQDLGSEATAANLFLTTSANVGLLAKPLPADSIAVVGSLELS